MFSGISEEDCLAMSREMNQVRKQNWKPYTAHQSALFKASRIETAIDKKADDLNATSSDLAFDSHSFSNTMSSPTACDFFEESSSPFVVVDKSHDGFIEQNAELDFSLVRAGLSRYKFNLNAQRDTLEARHRSVAEAFVSEIATVSAEHTGKIFLAPPWQSSNIVAALLRDKDNASAIKILCVSNSEKVTKRLLLPFQYKGMHSGVASRHYYESSHSPIVCIKPIDVSLLLKLFLSALEKDPSATTPLQQFSFIVADSTQTWGPTLMLLSMVREIVTVRGVTNFPHVILPTTISKRNQIRDYFGFQTVIETETFKSGIEGLTFISAQEAAAITNTFDPSSMNDTMNDKMFFAEACNTIFPKLMETMIQSLWDMWQTDPRIGGDQTRSAINRRCPVIVVYCCVKAPWLSNLDAKLIGLENSQRRLGRTVKTLRSIDEVQNVFLREQGSMSQIFYVLVLEAACPVNMLEMRFNVSIAAVVDFGHKETICFDGDVPDGDTTNGSFPNSSLTFQHYGRAPQDELDLRAYSAGGGLYVQLHLLNSQKAGEPSQLNELPPTTLANLSSRHLLSYLRSPIDAGLPSTFMYPTGFECSLNLLKSLGMVGLQTPYAPTMLGEFVDRFRELVSVENGFIVLALAALGLPELGAAIAAVATTPITRMCNFSRQKYSSIHSGANASLAKNSDLLTDTLYFLTEFKRHLAVEKQEDFTLQPRLLDAIDTFKNCFNKLQKLSFIKPITQSLMTPTSIGDIMHDLTENYHVAVAVIVAAYASNACEINDTGVLTPLFMQTSGRKLRVHPMVSKCNSGGVLQQVASSTLPCKNHIIVPRSFIYARNSTAESLLDCCTLVDRNFFFAAVVALRPTMECLVKEKYVTFCLTVHSPKYIHSERPNELLALRARMNYAFELLGKKYDLAENVNQEAFGAHLGLHHPTLVQEAKTLLVNCLIGQKINATARPISKGFQRHTADFCYSCHQSTLLGLIAFEKALLGNGDDFDDTSEFYRKNGPIRHHDSSDDDQTRV